MRRSLASLLLLLVTHNISRAMENSVPLPFLPQAEFASSATPATGPAGQPAIQVKAGAPDGAPAIIKCPPPTIPGDRYVGRGHVQYDGVTGDGYLALWTDFGARGKFFTRSLSDWGA